MGSGFETRNKCVSLTVVDGRRIKLGKFYFGAYFFHVCHVNEFAICARIKSCLAFTFTFY